MWFSKMDFLYEYTRSIGKQFYSRREWHSFALALQRKGLVESYRRKTSSGVEIDGYRIIELAALKKELERF